MADRIEPATYAAKCLEQMTGSLGIKTSVTGSGEGKRVVLNVKTDEPGRLIGRGGRVLNNFDYLLNRILAGKCEEQVRAKIDVEGGSRSRADNAAASPGEAAPRERRQKSPARREGGDAPQTDDKRLERLALDAAKEVKRWGDPKTIGPFTSTERKVIHSALKDDSTVKTESGEEISGRRKKITISMAE